MSETVSIVLTNSTDELERLNQFVEEFGTQHNLHVEEQYAVYLCLEELVTNICNYAWSDGGEHGIQVHLAVDPEFVKVTIEDDGMAFDPTKHPEPDLNKPAAERQIGGLGIHLVRQNMNEMWYSRQENRNILILRKKRKQA
jgi:serine/threonine-protein kinase RsbW